MLFRSVVCARIINIFILPYADTTGSWRQLVFWDLYNMAKDRAKGRFLLVGGSAPPSCKWCVQWEGRHRANLKLIIGSPTAYPNNMGTFQQVTGLRLRKRLVQCFPILCCVGRSGSANCLRILIGTGCPQSSRVSQKRTIASASCAASSRSP